MNAAVWLSWTEPLPSASAWIRSVPRPMGRDLVLCCIERPYDITARFEVQCALVRI